MFLLGPAGACCYRCLCTEQGLGTRRPCTNSKSVPGDYGLDLSVNFQERNMWICWHRCARARRSNQLRHLVYRFCSLLGREAGRLRPKTLCVASYFELKLSEVEYVGINNDTSEVTSACAACSEEVESHDCHQALPSAGDSLSFVDKVRKSLEHACTILSALDSYYLLLSYYCCMRSLRIVNIGWVRHDSVEFANC